ncbi:MAG TPA: hypothetical protein VGZ32_01900 [Actinocrinis sp.]|uniref:terpene synthase family protein n=1 Tax=Actinocrinis sp. TaxID=1920516 RepID=UPI002DDD99A3|nr:hypothetical protein [Actinocrinis sp.]HEV3169060.1 hypothetical protein [Actinocrinis sp.]
MISLPFPPGRNPHGDAARAHLDRWVREQRLVVQPAAARRFAEADFAGFAALTHPTIDEVALCLIADWFAWLFLLDDQLDDGFIGYDPRQVNALVVGIMEVLDSPGDHGPRPYYAPLIAALANLWSRTAPEATAAWRQRFTAHILAAGAAALWEADNRAVGLVPDPSVYIEKRRHTGAIYVCMDLVEVLHGIDVPDDAYADGTFQAALAAACDVVCWTNDLYSVDKERALGEYHNLVYVVEHHLELDRAQAATRVAADIHKRVEDYLDDEQRLLDRVDCPREVEVCLGAMRAWMRGNLDWSARTPRYGPTGPGHDDLEAVAGGAG